MSKKKILLLSDDLRMNSGIATMSREIVVGTAHKYHWAQIAGAMKHPEAGKIADLSQATDQMLGIKGSYIRLYPVDGYGNEAILYQIMAQEKPDASQEESSFLPNTAQSRRKASLQSHSQERQGRR